MNPKSPTPVPPQDGPASEQQALQDALAGLLSSLARLAVARGLPFATVEEMLKLAFVQSADQAHPGLLAHRKVSRISTSTGINRREVTRLTQQAPRAAGPGRSLASELFTHWRTQRPYRDAAGEPRTLPRLGPAPSFESLAQAITRDVHPRSLLDELCRLGLAQLDAESDSVTLVKAAFVPRGDRARMLGFLGSNVGDHLRAAVDNVLAHDAPPPDGSEVLSPHFEQALFADGLSQASLAKLRPLITEQWRQMRAQFVPALQALIDEDAAQGRPAQGRVRLGLYSLHVPGDEPTENADPDASDEPAAPEPKAKTGTKVRRTKKREP